MADLIHCACSKDWNASTWFSPGVMMAAISHVVGLIDIMDRTACVLVEQRDRYSSL
jgi:hypothetical protein